MTVAPAASRASHIDGRTIAGYVAVPAIVAIAVLATIALGNVDASARAALVRGAELRVNGPLATAFGPETAAMGADGAALGWLATYAQATLAATPLGIGATAAAAAWCALGTFAFVAWRSMRLLRGRRGACETRYVLGALALVFCSSLDALHVGGALTASFFAAVLLLALDLATPVGIAAVGIVTVLWCNADPTGVLAPIFALARAIGCYLDARRSRATTNGLVAAAIACLATLATPEELRFPALAVAALQWQSDLNAAIAWAPAALAPQGYRIGFFASVVVALALGLRARGMRDALPGLVGIVVALTNGALVPLAAIVAAPTLAAAAASLRSGARTGEESSASRRADVANDRRVGSFPTPKGMVLTGLTILALSIAFGFASRPRLLADARRVTDPMPALRAVARVRGIRRIAYADLAWCDDAVALGLRVLADRRIGAMPQAVGRAQTAIARARSRWRRDADAFGVDAIVVGSNATLATLLSAEGWRRVGAGERVAAYVRSERRS